MLIESYKNRNIDYTKKVYVYKNLIKKCYSIRQNGLVVAHTTRLMLKNVTFKVNEKSRHKVLQTKVRNIHAFAHGTLAESGMGLSYKDSKTLPAVIKYNPYRFSYFFVENLSDKPIRVKTCPIVKFDNNSMTGAYLNT